MTVYHLNPTTGEPGLCKALKACPFSSLEAHYSSEAEARKAYETQMDASQIVARSFSSLCEGSRIVILGEPSKTLALELQSRGFDVVVASELTSEAERWSKLGVTHRNHGPADSLPFADSFYIPDAGGDPYIEDDFPRYAKNLPTGGSLVFSCKAEELSRLLNAASASGFLAVTTETDPRGEIHCCVALEAPVEDSYHMNHQPDAEGAHAYDVEPYFPDFYSQPKLYDHGKNTAYSESIKAIMAIRGKPEAEVTIYRAVPKESYTIETGNWVTLSKAYAKGHGEQFEGAPWPVISMKVKAKDIRTPGDDINEWGYFPTSEESS